MSTALGIGLGLHLVSAPPSGGLFDSALAYYSADDLTGGDGSKVQTWADRSSNGYDLTQDTESLRPTLYTNVLNGKPLVWFDGTDDFMDASDPIITTAPWTVIALMVVGADKTSRRWMGNERYEWGILERNNSPWPFWFTTKSVKDYQTSGSAHSHDLLTPVVYKMQFDADYDAHFYRNGTLQKTVSGDSEGSRTPGNMRVGKSLGFTANTFKGGLAALAFFDGLV